MVGPPNHSRASLPPIPAPPRQRSPLPNGGYLDDGDRLGTTNCELNGTKLTTAAAAVLKQGMQDAEIPGPYRMGEKLIRANTVICVDEQTKRSEAGPWSCTFTSVGR